MKLGSEKLFSSEKLQKKYKGARVGVLCHGASVDKDLQHIMDNFFASKKFKLTCAFGPQHGIRAEKQDNMIESQDFIHPKYKIPIYSLYGEFRRPQKNMLDHLDVLFVDMQDVGCRIYTFLTTLLYCLEEFAENKKTLVVLDRPNPAGRPIEGNRLNMEFTSFVGAAPIPMRHGLTLGEAALWYKAAMNLDVDLHVIEMDGYSMKNHLDSWPKDRVWVNPSPNIPRVSCTQMYPGTVLLEGTLTSEGRGTTLPLEMFGAPNFDGEKIIEAMTEMGKKHLQGAQLRACFFEPTFHKHQGKLCGGLQIHTDFPKYKMQEFFPYRVIALYLKAVRMLYPNFDLWRPAPYEYEKIKMPIDILSGDDRLRKWVDSNSSKFSDFEKTLAPDEKSWAKERKPYLLY